MVSVIIPVFNGERYIDKTVRTVLDQTVQDFEVIINDDGSTDGTGEILRRLQAADPRIRILSTPAAHNPAVKRQEAVDEARGKYLAFLDADDRWLPRKLERQLERLEGLDEPGVCYTLTKPFSEKPMKEMRGWPRVELPETREAQFRLQILKFNWAATSTLLVRRDFFHQVGPLADEPTMKHNDIQDWIIRSLVHRPLICVPEELVQYHVHEGSLSLSRSKRGDWMRFYEVQRRADERGDLRPELRRKAYSVSFLRKAEEELALGEAGWRRTYLRSWMFDPLNFRRWPNLLFALMAISHARRVQKGLKRLLGEFRETRRRRRSDST
jgi:teichuronic acid biosynthesis glycosyltransferase TuaG